MLTQCLEAKVFIVGTKSDLLTKPENPSETNNNGTGTSAVGTQSQKTVTNEEALDFVYKTNNRVADYFLCSALTQQGVREIFARAVKEVLLEQELKRPKRFGLKKRPLKCVIM